jgi:hypothetical protein
VDEAAISRSSERMLDAPAAIIALVVDAGTVPDISTH